MAIFDKYTNQHQDQTGHSHTDPVKYISKLYESIAQIFLTMISKPNFSVRILRIEEIGFVILKRCCQTELYHIQQF